VEDLTSNEIEQDTENIHGFSQEIVIFDEEEKVLPKLEHINDNNGLASFQSVGKITK